MAVVLITGANRGIGLALARQYVADGSEVIACCRNPAGAEALGKLAASSGGKVRVMQLDVTDQASITALKHALGDKPLDILINNAGISDPNARTAERIDPETWVITMRVNALGPMLVSEALRDNLRRSSEKKLAAITSIMGSTSNANGGSSFAYRASKAALNNGMRGLSRAWAGDGILVGLLNPGWVQTDMVEGQVAYISPEECARGLIRRIAELTPATSGLFQDYRGVVTRW